MLNKIKDNINKNLGESVKIIYNGSRNKKEEYSGIIKEVWHDEGDRAEREKKHPGKGIGCPLHDTDGVGGGKRRKRHKYKAVNAR